MRSGYGPSALSNSVSFHRNMGSELLDALITNGLRQHRSINNPSPMKWELQFARRQLYTAQTSVSVIWGKS